jgi:hypothetical protein
MHAWEITIAIQGGYTEVSDIKTQEKYHNFINEILYGHDTYYQVEEFPGKMVITFGATTEERLQNIIETHQQIFEDAPQRDTPLDIKFRVYESIN